MTDMKEPLKGADENIYGISKLKKKLENSFEPSTPQSIRSLISPKSFQPEKLSNFG